MPLNLADFIESDLKNFFEKNNYRKFARKLLEMQADAELEKKELIPTSEILNLLNHIGKSASEKHKTAPEKDKKLLAELAKEFSGIKIANNESHEFSTIHGRIYFQMQIEEAIIAIEKKAIKLDSNAKIWARNLANDIKSHKSYTTIDNIINIPNKETGAAVMNFYNRCKSSIAIAENQLGKNRGWKRFLGNLAAMLLGGFVLYGMAALINKKVRGHYLFFNDLPIQKEINQLKKLNSSLVKK